MYKAIRERVAREILDRENKRDDFYDDYDIGGVEVPSINNVTDKILSIRLNDKGEPDPMGEWEIVARNRKTGQLEPLRR